MIALNFKNTLISQPYLSGAYPTAPVSKKEDYLHRMEKNVHDIASAIADFAHRAIRISYTGESRLNPGSNSFVQEMCYHMNDEQVGDYLALIDTQIKEARNNLLSSFDRKKALGISRDSALAQVYAELVIHSIESNIGNCAEKALLAGILLKSLMPAALTQQGYTDFEIENANLRITIAENGMHGGDHTVCLLQYDIGEEKVIVVDPWLNGIIYAQEDAQAVFDESLNNPNEPAIFDKVDSNKTQAVNDEECVAEVMQSVKNIFGEDLNFFPSSKSGNYAYDA